MQFHGRSEVGQSFGGAAVHDGLFYGFHRLAAASRGFYGFRRDGYAVYH